MRVPTHTAKQALSAVQQLMALAEPELAIRAGVVHVPRLAPIDESSCDAGAADDAAAQPVSGGGGTVLITGGTGGLAV